ncbi:MAG: hypothetical protein JW818_09415 [Pirellulales bacterium]|nr:hypothetical protein [Pirellulales bacterium]
MRAFGLFFFLVLTTCLGCTSAEERALRAQVQGVWYATITHVSEEGEERSDTVVLFLRPNGHWVNVVLMGYPKPPYSIVFTEEGTWSVRDDKLCFRPMSKQSDPGESTIVSVTSESLVLSSGFEDPVSLKRDSGRLEAECRETIEYNSKWKK